MIKLSYLLIFCYLLFFQFPLAGQTTGKIAGQIFDATTGEPLPGVNVIIKNTRITWHQLL